MHFENFSEILHVTSPFYRSLSESCIIQMQILLSWFTYKTCSINWLEGLNKKTNSSPQCNSVGRWGFRESINNSFSPSDLGTYFQRQEV